VPLELPADVDGPGGSRGPSRWGTAVLLRNWLEGGRGRVELCACPIVYSRVPRMDAGFDDEVFEPVIRIQIGDRPSKAKVFNGRTAARRGIWIGGTSHFDDFVVPGGEPGAAALLIYEPRAAQWRLLPGARRLVILPQTTPEYSLALQPELEDINFGPRQSDDARPIAADSSPLTEPEELAVPGTVGQEAAGPEAPEEAPQPVPAEGVVLKRLMETACRLADGPLRQSILLEPSFVARRYSSAAVMPEDVASPADARRMRERLVLLLAKTEIRAGTPLAMGVLMQKSCTFSQLCAVLTDFAVGRGESCNLRFPEVLSVSRSHCVLSLSEAPGERARLVAYDDGSLGGTQLHKGSMPLSVQRLGVGRRGALELAEGDSLKLGNDVTVTLASVSPVLQLDDHRGLAEFFERLGERRTAQTLRQEPRLTEVIVSSSLSAPLGEGDGWDDREDPFAWRPGYEPPRAP